MCTMRREGHRNVDRSTATYQNQRKTTYKIFSNDCGNSGGGISRGSSALTGIQNRTDAFEISWSPWRQHCDLWEEEPGVIVFTVEATTEAATTALTHENSKCHTSNQLIFTLWWLPFSWCSHKVIIAFFDSCVHKIFYIGKWSFTGCPTLWKEDIFKCMTVAIHTFVCKFIVSIFIFHIYIYTVYI